MIKKNDLLCNMCKNKCLQKQKTAKYCIEDIIPVEFYIIKYKLFKSLKHKPNYEKIKHIFL